MPKTKEQKKETIESLKEKIKKQKAILFVDICGLKVKQLSNLRKELKNGDNELKVAKKTIMGIALKESKLDVDPNDMEGEVALVFGYKDEISLSKIVWQFCQKNPNLKILAGILENKFVEDEKIITLAELPSREELLARLTGSVSAPISNLINVLEGNIKGLIYALSAINNNK
ncbi:50S ribosomal protein L10 [Patescibacteria group bacterium]|nr:50S ribosomal protein L10 [Patescibacteria group bacterium]